MRDLLRILQLIALTIASVALAIVITIYVTWQRTADRWHKHDMQQWAEILQQRNPSLEVPPVDAITDESQTEF